MNYSTSIKININEKILLTPYEEVINQEALKTINTRIKKIISRNSQQNDSICIKSILKSYEFAVDLQRSKKYTEALTEFSILKEALFDEFWLLFYKIGECFWVENQYKLALDAFKKAVIDKPNLFCGYIRVANCHLALSEYIFAEEAFERALSIHPNNLELKKTIKQLKEINLPEKIKHVNKKQESSVEFAIQSLADYLTLNKNNEWAIEEITKLLAIDDNEKSEKNHPTKEIDLEIKLLDIILNSIEKKNG